MEGTVAVMRRDSRTASNRIRWWKQKGAAGQPAVGLGSARKWKRAAGKAAVGLCSASGKGQQENQR